jgi:hypothetical protein
MGYEIALEMNLITVGMIGTKMKLYDLDIAHSALIPTIPALSGLSDPASWAV